MKKLTRLEEISLFLCITSTSDQIAIEKRELERIRKLIRSIPQPTSEELALVTKVLDYRTKDIEKNESYLEEMMMMYQHTDSSAPIVYPEWMWDNSLAAEAAFERVKKDTKATKPKKEK